MPIFSLFINRIPFVKRTTVEGLLVIGCEYEIACDWNGSVGILQQIGHFVIHHGKLIPNSKLQHHGAGKMTFSAAWKQVKSIFPSAKFK